MCKASSAPQEPEHNKRQESSEMGSERNLSPLSVTCLKGKWNKWKRKDAFIVLPVTPVAALPENWWDLLPRTYSSPGLGQLSSKMAWAATSQFCIWHMDQLCNKLQLVFNALQRSKRSPVTPSIPHQSQFWEAFTSTCFLQKQPPPTFCQQDSSHRTSC